MDQVLVPLQADSEALRGRRVQTESSLRSHRPTEVESCCVFQELPSEQILLEAPGGGASQSLQSPAHRGEQAMQDFDQLRQKRGGVRVHWEEVPERLEEGETGGWRATRGGLKRRLNGTREETGQSQTALRAAVGWT